MQGAGARIPVAASAAFDTALSTLARQDALVDALDAKVGTLLAAEGVLAAFVFGVSRDLPAAFLSCALGSLLISAGFALASFWPRRFAAVPDARAFASLAAGSPDMTERELKWWFIRNAIEGIEENRYLVHRKVKWLKVSSVALLVTIAALGAGVLWTLIPG